MKLQQVVWCIVGFYCGVSVTCTPRRPACHLDLQLTPGVNRLWVERATEEWSRKTNATFTITDGDCEDCIVVEAVPQEVIQKEVIQNKSPVDNAIGLATPTGKIYITYDLVDPDGITVMTHEIGHAFGLSHINLPWALMNPQPLPSAGRLSCEDVAQYSRLRGQEAPICVHLDRVAVFESPSSLEAPPAPPEPQEAGSDDAGADGPGDFEGQWP